MTEVNLGVRINAHSPDSDCNSNHPGSTTSCLSNASSQDIDFFQDNSDYQWFLDYNYRDGSTNHHTSILSLSEAYDANEVGYYDALAKNMDANLAEADMESFRTEDIHALLTNLPTMCTDPLSQETNRQGESFASVSGSMMAKFDFDSSISPHSSSQGEDSANSTSMSICKSELLFSPVKEIPMPGANFSVDSLDCELMTEHDIMLTCQANKDNYTIAFEGSMTLYSEDSDYHDTDKSGSASGTGSTHWESDLKTQTENLKVIENSMAHSDSGGFTTWSKLKKRSSENQLRRHPSGNNNSSIDCGGRYQLSEKVLKSQSLPNLYKQKLKGLLASQYLRTHNLTSSSVESCTSRRKPVKVFDIQHQIQSSSGSGGSVISDMATSADAGSTTSEHSNKHQPNFNLVKLFMKQKSLSAEGMSMAMDQSSVSENWPVTQSGVSCESFGTKLLTNSLQTKTECFVDSLLVEQKANESNARTHDLIIEEQDEEVSRSESVERLSESESKEESCINSFENDYERTSPSPLSYKFNLNNNNSIEQRGTACRRRLKVHGTQTRRNNSLGVSLSSDSTSISSFTPSEPTEYSRIPKLPPKTTSTQVPVHLMNRSIQTSCFIDSLTKAPYKLNCNSAREVVKVIEPSFLNKLKQEGVVEKPVYVLYPNYVLPNLDFLKEKQEDVTKVFLLPQRGPAKALANKKRPFSCNDVESLKRKGFSHVRDWDSLNFLLPNEYRQILADVPEIAGQISNEPLRKQRPSFCASPPVRRKARPNSCDCTTAVLERTSSLDRATNISSSSSTATQPSSGYRGSSTMLLTDSQNSPAPSTNLNPLFVYRYDSVTSSDASLMTSERQRSVTTAAPPLPKRSISLSHEHNTKLEMIPPRPPLPKGILRKTIENAKLRKNKENSKRYSMFEMSEDEVIEEMVNKRLSLQEPYYTPRSKRFSETEDEGVDAGTSSSSLDEPQMRIITPLMHAKKTDVLLSNISCEELAQLEEYLKISGISSSDPEDLDEEEIMQLRSCVTKFLSLKINQEGAEHFGGKKSVSFAEKVNVLTKNVEMKPPNNSPNASAVMNQRYQNKTLADMPIREEGETSPENYSSPQSTPTHSANLSYDLNQKRSLVSAVTEAVEKLIRHFSPATNQTELNELGDSVCNPACAKLALSTLCPALYAILSDGLKPNLETSFGPITNSVWQVVEASAQQGPLTKALNELVMRINGEDVITEGLVKFNAFVFGLLNVRSLDAWTSYLRTRESVLRKHYRPDSLLVLAHTGGSNVRGLLDTLISTLEPLALLPFQFDLLFEYRQLHLSLKRMDCYQQPPSPTRLRAPSPTNLTTKQWHLIKLAQSIQSSLTESVPNCEATPRKPQQTSPDTVDPSLPDLLNSSATSRTHYRNDRERPRSCIDPGVLTKANFKLGEDVTSIAKKRWSGISLTSKLYQAYDKLAHEEEEEYTDSLETCPKPLSRVRAVDTNEDSSSNGEAPSLRDDGPESLESNMSDDKPLNGRRFKKLQLKWEKLSGRDSSSSQSPPLSPTHTGKSKIPRPVTSPVRLSGIPVPVISPTTKASKTGKKVITPPSSAKKNLGAVIRTNSGNNLVKNAVKSTGGNTIRTSRLDQLENNVEAQRHVTRPSSLPYKPTTSTNKVSKLTPPRRAVSSSLSRKPLPHVQTPKIVRTLSHRLPSESGHLSYNEGERLKVILEVDEKWFLCCRGMQKGLVPRSAVIADTGRF